MNKSNFLLSEQLEKFLDNDLLITTHSDKPSDASFKAPIGPIEPSCLNLLSNVQIDKSSCVSDLLPPNSTKHPRKFTDKFRIRMQSKIYSSQKDLEMKCKSVAIDPEYILSKRGVLPWPEPKNVRYIERYRKVKDLANGSFVAVPIEQKTSHDQKMNPVTNQLEVKKEENKNNNSNNKINNSSNNDNKINSSINNNKIKSSSNNNNDNNIRKQKRKRGMKKKNDLISS